MNKNKKDKTERIEFRASKADKNKIKRFADKCNLSVSDYLLLRALGYEPKATPPDAFFDFYRQLCVLCNAPISSESEAKLLNNFLKSNNLHSVSDVLNYCKSCETEISALESERQKIRNSNRRPKTQEERQTKNRAAREITQKIKPLRQKLKKADSVLNHFDYVWDLLKTERAYEEKALIKNRSKGAR